MKKLMSLILALAMLICSGAAFAQGTVATPIVEEPVTITVAVASNSYCLVPWSEKEFYQQISAETNVYFEWNELNDWTTQTNLLVASGDMPDLFMGSLSKATMNENIDMFYELTDLINEYCPTLVKVFEDEPTVLAGAKSNDGGIYVLPIGFTYSLDSTVGTMYWINQNWLDAVGMENPTTLEDFETVLKAFRDNDLNQNGVADEIPLSLQEKGWAGKFTDLFGIFGVLYDTANYVDCDDDGKVYFQASQDEFYQALVWLNGLAKEGLLDKESLSQTTDQLTGKISQNMLGVVAKYNPQNFLDGFVPMHIITGPNEKILFEGSNDSVAQAISMPADCEYADVICKVYEYINSDFARKMTSRFGEEGVYWERTGEGNNYTLHDYDSQPPEGYEFWDQYVYTHGETGSSGFQLINKQDYSGNVSPKTIRETAILEYIPYFPAVAYHEGPISDMETSEKGLLYVEIDAYVQSFVAEAIFGTIDENVWANHLAQLQALQVDRYVELCQNAYDAYVALLG